MKSLLIAALVAAQIVSTPAVSATLEPIDRAQLQSGAFAGARVRIALGAQDRGKVRAGLGIAPIRSGQLQDGRLVTRFGEGMEFGVRDAQAPTLSIAGRSLSADDDKKGGGIPTWALVVGGVLVVLGVGLALGIDALQDASE